MTDIEREQLFQKNMRLARITLYKVFPKPKVTAKRKCLDLEDMFQYAYTGLWKACLTYDPDKGTSFRTHAINHIKWHLIEKGKREGNQLKYEANKDYLPEELPLIKSMDKQMNTGLSNGAEETSNLHDIIRSATQVESQAMGGLFLQELLKYATTEDEIKIIKLRMNKELTYDEIGKQYYGGQTGEAVRAKVRKLKTKMKRYIQEAAMV